MRSFVVLGMFSLLVALSGCDNSTVAQSATITMGVGQFTGNTNVTLKIGGTLTLDDSSGGSHNLVTGTNGQFSAEQGAPAGFVEAGIPFSAGDKKNIVFSTAGVYHITCTLHPSMQATITVTAASAGGNGY
jgi:plastocyanin